MTIAPYGWLTLGGVAVSLTVWRRIARQDPRLLTIYLGGLAGALVGAKLVYFFAEGWLHLGATDMWRQLATGKSILGGLLGGYVAVEGIKRLLGYTGITGDRFALIVPLGVAFGRLGCWASGCCLGVECRPAWFTLQDVSGHARWPAVPVELLFNLLALACFFWLHRTKRLPGQHFHLYLIGYGLFRFFHEFLRQEPRILGPLSGYQIAALAVFLLGLWRFVTRRLCSRRIPWCKIGTTVTPKSNAESYPQAHGALLVGAAGRPRHARLAGACRDLDLDQRAQP